MILNRYMKVATMYQKSINDEKELVSKIDDTLSKTVYLNTDFKISDIKNIIDNF